MAKIVFNRSNKHVVLMIEDEHSNVSFPEDFDIIEADSIELARVLLKKKKGEDVMNRFISENEQIQIPTEQNLIQMQYLLPVKQLLESGAITSAMEVVSQLPDEAFIITPGYTTATERRNSFVNEMFIFIQAIG